MKHADTEIPQEESAIITDATKSIGLMITAPWIECDGRNEGIMSLAASYNFAFGERPDGEKVILTTSNDIFSVGRPTDADYTTVVASEDVQNSVLNLLAPISTVRSRLFNILFFQVVH